MPLTDITLPEDDVVGADNQHWTINLRRHIPNLMNDDPPYRVMEVAEFSTSDPDLIADIVAHSIKKHLGRNLLPISISIAPDRFADILDV